MKNSATAQNNAIKRGKYCFNSFGKMLYRLSEQTDSNLLLSSIKEGFMTLVPIFMVGAFALLLQNIPIKPVADFVARFWEGRIYTFLDLLFEGTYGLISLYILICVSYRYASNLDAGRLMSAFCSVVAIGSYMALLGVKVTSDSGQKMLLLSDLNVQNVFSALVVSVTSTKLFLTIYNGFNRLSKKSVRITTIELGSFLRAILPMTLVIGLFSLLSIIITVLFAKVGAKNFNELIILALTAPFDAIGVNIGSGIPIVFLQSLFWFFGIHGSNTFESVNLRIFQNLSVSGSTFTKTFFDTFVLMGGCGTSICLLIALLLFSKNKPNKTLCKTAFFPMIFNINEIMVFGLPIVLNPVYLIPFVLTPIFALVSSYLFTLSGFLPNAVNTVTWTTPVFFSGFMATKSLNGSVVQLFNIVIGTLIYAPFVVIGDKITLARQNEKLDEMVTYYKQCEKQSKQCIFYRLNNRLSVTAHELGYALHSAVDEGKIEMFYQPQHDDSGRVVACEALLRWGRNEGEYIYPPLIVSISKEEEIYDRLTQLVLIKSMQTAIDINRNRTNKICVSANIEASQFADGNFTLWLLNKAREMNLPKGVFGVELTEEADVTVYGDLSGTFNSFKEYGIEVAIDDFSMGRTSLKFLEDNCFDYVKLDGGLVRSMMSNARSKDIIISIIRLGKDLRFKVIAEYVETASQRDMLHEMGCNIYQGYVYSPALNQLSFVNYVEEYDNKILVGTKKNNNENL